MENNQNICVMVNDEAESMREFIRRVYDELSRDEQLELLRFARELKKQQEAEEWAAQRT